MTDVTGGGMLGPEFFTPGSSSFTQFLAEHREELLPTRSRLPVGVVADQGQVPHGTTVLALTYRDGVLMAGDRRATMGNVIARRDLEKVYPADDHAAVAFAGTVGLALDLVKLYQVELTHFEKVEGIPMTLNAKATRLSTMIRQNLGQAMQGLAVIPLLAGYDINDRSGRPKGRIFGYDVTGGLFEKSDYLAEGSGSPHAKGALKKLYRPGMSREDAALTAIHALFDAADDDSATGGPDVNRGIFPVLVTVTEDGYQRIPAAETESLTRQMLTGRADTPDGPVAPLV